MKANQANRARIAQRATTRPAVMPAHLRPAVSAPMAPGPTRRSTALPMTGAQRDSEGRMSAWARPAEIGGSLGLVIRDAKWSRTVSDR